MATAIGIERSLYDGNVERHEGPPLRIGDRVIWLGEDVPEPGTIKWIGILPDISKGWAAGVELDNPVGGIDGSWGGKELFSCKPRHGMVIDVNGLIKERDFLGDNSDASNGHISQDETSESEDSGELSGEPKSMQFQMETVSDGGEDVDCDSSDSGDSDVNTLAVSRLLKYLELAISEGKLDEAASLARDLAQLKIQCSVTQNRQPNGKKNEPAPVILNMFVEDKVSHHGPIPIRVVPSITVKELKNKIFHEFEFPPQIQRWILGRKLATDDEAQLSTFGIASDGCPVFLYLLSIDDVPVKAKDLVWDNESTPPLRGKMARGRSLGPERPKRDRRSAPKRAKSSDGVTPERVSSPKQEEGWQCKQCTLINCPTRPGCSMCGTPRPEDYVIPSKYVMQESEVQRLRREEENERATREAEDFQRLQNWQHYLQLDDQDLIYNDTPFECAICFAEAPPGEGVKLRDCLHTFCCDCLRNAITHSEEATVKCPYRDEQYSCESVLQEREIRALVPPEMFERHLQRSIVTAESQAPNSFHCKTPDCKSWCLLEDNANHFECPICKHQNCITCRVIHEGMDCKQYQAQLTLLARTDEEAKKTMDAVEVMLTKGEAMKCPSCQVIIMKKWGCDWLCCSICKTEICWVTKGPRWGAKGRGDTLGGCRCGINGVRCHPNCNYCH